MWVRFLCRQSRDGSDRCTECAVKRRRWINRGGRFGGQNGGIKVSLPKGGQANAVKEVHDLAIAVLSDGRVVVQGKVVDQEGLKKVLEKARAENPETLVLVQADEGVAHGKVVAVMDMARREGLPRLAIATRADAP